MFIIFFILVCLKCVTKNFHPAEMSDWCADCECSLGSLISMGCFPFLTVCAVPNGPSLAAPRGPCGMAWLCVGRESPLFGRKGIPHIPVGFEQLYVRILTLPSNCGLLYGTPHRLRLRLHQRGGKVRWGNVSKVNRSSWGFMPMSQAFTGKGERKTVAQGIR